ncbi:MAG: RtcB family protein [Bacteroidaceae bacterium]|nr:RtcB family protein [Bacteroidaceae bacterium]
MEKVEIIGKTVVKMWTTEFDDKAREQIENLASLPFVHHHIALMPDCHGGKGMPIGGVLPTKDVVIPNAVGVDIGCGMCAVKTNIRARRLTENILRKVIMKGIRERIPLGMDHHKEMQAEKYLPTGFDLEKLPVVKSQYISIQHQVGTLGGGNHFIELQRDEDGWLWIMIHSGSRNLGKQVGDFYNKKAKWLNELYYSKVESELMLPFLPLKTQEFNDYWGEMNYCVAFAKCNRQLMMERIKEVIVDALPLAEFEPTIDIAHNYAAFENHFRANCIVHRKGAVRARAGEIGIIPGSQGTSSYIVEGLGNPDSFMSSSHGAGRLMSRMQAIKTLSLEDEIKKMESKGIVHSIRSQRDLDEAASAYKDIDQVIALESDLVKVKTKLEPIAVIKGQ